MDDSATTDGFQLVAKKYNNVFPDKKSPRSRRTLSFSSSSSFSLSSSSSLRSSSYIFPDESPLGPATPLRFSGKPFSWEHLPGVPKKNVHKKKESTLNNIKQLPLPPPVTPPASKKQYHFQDSGNSKKFSSSSESFRIKDPFVAALVECSKDDDDDEDSSTRNFWSGSISNKVARSISDRFGFVNLYTSCKRACAVSESVVYLPRSNRSSYNLINRRI